MTREFDFFLSHNRAEKEWTRTLNEVLRERGATTFFDEESIAFGDDIVTAIGEALRTSRHLVFVLSPGSIQSRWVELEWTSSLYDDPDAQERRVLPILKEDCEIPYLLKRLRYIDARHSSVADVADSLLSVLSHDSPASEPDAPQPKSLQIAGALRFGSPQYVRRQSDSRVEEGLRRGEAILIYGPRMFGKTSMLIQVGAGEILRGSSVIWLDLQAHMREDADSFMEGIGYQIASELNKEWEVSDLPPAVRIRRLFAEWTSNVDEQAVLLIDEYDVITIGQAGTAFGNFIRAVLSDPNMRNLSCAIAGLHPPWMEICPVGLSPWWNLFHIERISHFSPEQVVRFCTWLGGEAEKHADTLSELTGGHPGLIAKAGYEYSSGIAMAEILADPLKPDGPFFAIAWSTVRSTVQLLKDRRVTLASVRDGKEVPRAEDREALWLMGLVKSPRENPPLVSGTVFRKLISRLIDEES